MKKLFYTLLMFSLPLISCGDDGNEGRAFLKFDWSNTVTGYNDSNPDIPYSIWKNQSYPTDKGSYYFSYLADNGTTTREWSGSYTITKNPGEKGGFLVDGEDGSDKHFKLYLGWSGPQITSYKSVSNKDIEENENSANLINDKNPNLKSDQTIEFKEEIVCDGNFTIKLRFQLHD